GASRVSEIFEQALDSIVVSQETRVSELFTERTIVAARVNGELKDLFYVAQPGEVVEPVHLHSEDGLNILRHSAAHVLAQAVQQVNPQARLGIGPPITDGFYYDFDIEETFSPEDLKQLQ